MSTGILTNAGRDLFAQKAGAGEVLTIDRFLLANIPGLDPQTAADPDEALPDIADRVAELSVTKSGYVNEDKVVYSLYLGTGDGDYTFNWVGILADDDTLVAVRYIEPITKYATAGASVGNSITRNFLITYTDAQSITNVTVDASTWQLSFDQATEVIAGLSRRATQQEVDDGDDDLTHLTPNKLAKCKSISRSYRNLDEWLNDTKVREGQIVEIRGRNYPGDGGANTIEMVQGGTGVHDSGSYIDHPISGLQGKGLFPGGKVIADQFGDPNEVSINAAIKYAATLGGGNRRGGEVHLLAKIYTLSGPIKIPQGVFLKGAGQMATSLMKSNSSDDYWMVESENFEALSGSNLWLESDGVPTGFGIFDLSIYGVGNPPVSSDTRGGLRFYGKRYYVQRVIIHNVDGDGAWFQCAASGGQFQWRDLPEGQIDQLFVFSAGRDGIVYEGPHDGATGEIFASSCGRDGVVFRRTSSTSATSEVSVVHSYGNAGRGVVVDSPMHFGTLIGESNQAEGVVFVNGFNSKVEWLQAYSNCESSGNYQVDIQSGSNNLIVAGLQMTGAAGSNIGGISNAAQEVQINNLKIQMGGSGVGITNSASHCKFSGIVAGFTASGGKGLHVNNGAFSVYELDIRNCDTVLETVGDFLHSSFNIRGFSSSVTNLWKSPPTLSQRRVIDLDVNYKVGTVSYCSKARIRDSNTINIGEAGEYTIVAPHGLFSSPSMEDVSLSIGFSGANNGWRIKGPYLFSVDSTNITAKVIVDTPIMNPDIQPELIIKADL